MNRIGGLWRDGRTHLEELAEILAESDAARHVERDL